VNSPEFQRRAFALFDELIELAPERRGERLRALEREDRPLHAEVAALLAVADGDDAGMFAHSPATLLAADGIPGDADDALLEQRIGPWRIVDIIGHGGMGAVYRGERVEGGFQQQAAVKLIRMGLDQPALRQRFLRERQILARLQHPNIAALLDGGVSDAGAPYFAMELVDGEPIDRWCDARNLGLRERVRLFLQVCGAVQHAHRNLVVHRDLKPGNILVAADGQAKLLDFGIAKLLQDEAGATRERVLTPEFAAPEQISGEAITTATDVYALGIVLHRLLAGGAPFADAGAALSATTEPEAPSRTASRAGEDAARLRGLDPRRLASALRGDLDAIVRRCLQREPERRYASAEALANDLRAWLDARPVAAVRGDRGYRLRKFVARNRWGVAAASLAVAGVSIGLAIALWQARVAKRQAALARDNAVRAEASAKRALATKDFLVQLIAGTDALQHDQGAQLSAVDLLRAAAKQVDSGLNAAPDSQAELRVAIGSSLLSLGDAAQARDAFDRGIAQLHAQGIHGPVLANALYERSSLRRQNGDPDGAKADADAALAELQASPGDQRELLAKVRTNLANIAVGRGQLHEAQRQLQAVLHEREALLGKGTPELAVDWNNLGNADLKLDRYPEADAAFRRAIALLTAQSGPEHPRMVWLLLGLASAEGGEAARVADAHRDLDEAERIMRKALGERHPIAINLHMVRATIATREGDFPVAVAQLRQAMAVPGSDELHAIARAQLGLSLLLRGDARAAHAELEPALAAMRMRQMASDPQLNRLESAEGLARFRLGEREAGEAAIRAALQRLEAADFERTDDYAEATSDLAALLGESGRSDEASQSRRRAQALFAAIYGPGHPRTLRAAAG
jgi:serine/threonine-protein kinase